MTTHYYLGKEIAGYGYHFYENKSENDAILHAKLLYKVNEGVDLIYNNGSSSEVWTKVRSCKGKLLLIKAIESTWNTSYSYSYKFEYPKRYLTKQALAQPPTEISP